MLASKNLLQILASNTSIEYLLQNLSEKLALKLAPRLAWKFVLPFVIKSIQRNVLIAKQVSRTTKLELFFFRKRQISILLGNFDFNLKKMSNVKIKLHFSWIDLTKKTNNFPKIMHQQQDEQCHTRKSGKKVI